MEPNERVAVNGVMPRACRNCRQRKVRCNRVVPCANCVASNLACSSTSGSTTRASTQAPSNSANTVGLEARLASLEQAVRELSANGKARPGLTQPARNGDLVQSHENGDNLPEGPSSFSRQTLEAAEVKELVTSATSRSTAVMVELENLRSLANSRADHASPGTTYRSGAGKLVSPERELPPVELVLQALRDLRESQGGVYLMFTFYGIQDYAQVEDLARRVYFPIDPPSTADVTLLCGMLSIIFRELIRAPSSCVQLEDVSHVREICERGFYAGAETYDVMAIPSHQHLIILCLAMAHAQDKSKLNLEWAVTSTAARHCLCLGYHREERLAQLPAAEAETARHLFWYVYLFDKNFSCRLGRASIIQDYDVDASLCAVSTDPGRAPWDLAFNAFIELSRIHGQIFESLYAAATRTLDASERRQRSSNLAAQLTQWYDDWKRIDISQAYDKQSFESDLSPVPVDFYSILTLCYRGANLSSSAHDIDPACYEAAHRGLVAHLSHYPAYISAADRQPSYSLWIFYYTSFTPFVVTFLHCIANTDHADLKLLKEVVDSFEACTIGSDYAQRQVHLCKALYRIAEAFLTTERTAGINSAQPISNNLSLPLQTPVPGNWDWNDPSLQLFQFTDSLQEGWEPQDPGQAFFSLGHQM